MTLQTLPPGLNISGAFEAKVEESAAPTAIPVDAAAVLIRLRHMYAFGEGEGADSQPVTLDLSTVFAPRWKVVSAVEMTIDAAQPMASARAAQIPWQQTITAIGKSAAAAPIHDAARSERPLSFAVTLQPMDIRTFVLSVQS